MLGSHSFLSVRSTRNPDLAGRRVRTLLSEWRLAGPNTVQWRGLDDGGKWVASGVYLYRLEAGEHAETRRMTLLK